jgi:hypothetical protein
MPRCDFVSYVFDGETGERCASEIRGASAAARAGWAENEDGEYLCPYHAKEPHLTRREMREEGLDLQLVEIV